ncbi:MAG: hypothetical protein LQ342_005959 [Letrouitia transgressa]|nr:MAG: hypothetical protein LQ342_005959 [Letrouitia transgressa]
MGDAINTQNDSSGVANGSEPKSLAALTASLQDGKAHLLLAATGSIAIIKLPHILFTLSQRYPPSVLSIRLILTRNALRFFNGSSSEQPTLSSLSSFPVLDAIYLDDDEWSQSWSRDSSEILHISLRRWSHILVIAPLTATTLAKIVGGWADNLLTSVVRAWDTSIFDNTNTAADADADPNWALRRKGMVRRHIIVACAMNTAMWTHPVTAKQVRVLEEDWGVNGKNAVANLGHDGWFEVLRPQVKQLACGDTGQGAMCDWETIVKVIEDRLNLTAPAGSLEPGTI